MRIAFHRRQSRLAIAASLVAMAAMASAPADAQRRNRNQQKQQEQQQGGEAQYSDAMRTAYQPVQEALSQPQPDYQAVKAMLPPLRAAVSTPDDRLAVGRAIYNVGNNTDDVPLQREGLSLILESGKLPPENAANFNFEAGRLAYNNEDYANAARYFEAAKAAGATQENLDILIGQARGRSAGGNAGQGELAYLQETIQSQIAGGQTPNQQLLRQGLAIAYNNQMSEQTAQFSNWMLQYHPSAEAWRNAIAIQRNTTDFDANQLLDLMRLARATNSLSERNDYLAYIQAADARRLPGEVSEIISEGMAAGAISASDSGVSESKSIADSRRSADRADLPTAERQARASNANAALVSGTAHAFLSYDEPAKAEELYRIALTKSGADANEIRTRMGIAQVEQGKTAEAKATFAQVTGPRAAIAQLWSTYADQRAGGNATAMN